MARIESLQALEILDSRGNPTLACTCILDNGIQATASVPSGASTGSKEAHELRDHDNARYRGKGVLKAISMIETRIAPALYGQDPHEQEAIDDMMQQLDGTSTLQTLGANAILGVSLAVAKAAALDSGKPLYAYIGDAVQYRLPVPYMNVLNGGAHAANNIDIQEFMIVPAGFASFREALRAGTEIYHALAAILQRDGLSTSVGDEGGFAPNIPSIERAFEYLLEAIAAAGYQAGTEVWLAVDVAASEFYQEGQYHLQGIQKQYTPAEWVTVLADLVARYPIVSIEDGMAEDDDAGWKQLTEQLGDQVQLVGDDVFVTQARVLREGVDNGMANAILIKPNQVGTLTGTLLTIGLAKQVGYSAMVSHRSGETDDTFIADLAVACGTGQIKTGAPCRGERLAKYNRLLHIEQQLGEAAIFGSDSGL
jgi:enolase